MPLDEAVRRFLKPGMTVHAGCSFSFPHALWYEVARQFQGLDPRFTAVMAAGVSHNLAVWVKAGLCGRAITSIAGDAYPFPGPNPILQEAVADGRLAVSHWTMLTLTQRLLAGAMGLPFMPTKSIAGSSLELDAGDDYVRPPLGAFADADARAGADRDAEPPVGLVRALRPDISLVHALAADEAGNALITAPLAGNVYGALSARRGAIVTAERIVSHADIRRHAASVCLPASAVVAVCEAPYGAHPNGLAATEIPWFAGYSEDPEFILDAREACRSQSDFEDWMNEWVLRPRSHLAYVEKLGEERLARLRRRMEPDAWRRELSEAQPAMRRGPATASESMIALAGRTLADRIREGGHRTLLAGLGASNLAAWLAAHILDSSGGHVDLMAELGYYGYSPRPADPYLFNLRNLATCSQTTDILTVMGMYVGGGSAHCIGSLGAGQVDRRGNLNSTTVRGGRLLIGSGGANDVASTASDVVVCAAQSRSRFVEKVDYVTAPGRRVSAVATQHCLMEKPPGEEELTLTAFFANQGEHDRDAIGRALSACGWNLAVAPRARRLTDPSVNELAMLRALDPKRYFLGD